MGNIINFELSPFKILLVADISFIKYFMQEMSNSDKEMVVIFFAILFRSRMPIIPIIENRETVKSKKSIKNFGNMISVWK